MPLAFGTSAIVLLALLSVLVLPRLRLFPTRLRSRVVRARGHTQLVFPDDYDPGRELRAEQRARDLLHSCVNREEWDMYCELGFLRVDGAFEEQSCAYLVYPHMPIVAYEPDSGLPLGEYCIEFPDVTRPYGSVRLPDADDVLAKWMALVSDERSLIERSNMHLPGRQIGLAQVRRDLARLSRWERERLKVSHKVAQPARRAVSRDRAPLRVGSVPAR
jgi:hypothetical protein